VKGWSGQKRTNLDLPDGKVEEGHAISDLDDGLGPDATHGRSCTSTIQRISASTINFRVGDIGDTYRDLR
jgi:hypothetical protein